MYIENSIFIKNVDQFLSGFIQKIKNKAIYLSSLTPLILSLLVQRSEHIIDNRFISQLGIEPLKIHSIFYIFLIIGQSIGIASSSSLLILWKRRENRSKQFDIALKHLILTLGVSLFFGLIINLNLNTIISHFSISTKFYNVAHSYLKIGILNIGVQAILSLTLAILVAMDLLKLSFIFMSILFLFKVLIGIFATKYLWIINESKANILMQMNLIGIAGFFLVLILISIGIYFVSDKLLLNKKISFNHIFEIWNSEIVIAFIRTLAPTLFSYQLATLSKSSNLFVIYQLSLQAAYLLVLPISAANQIAVRDASREQSITKIDGILPLNSTSWFNNYFYSVLIPNLFILFLFAIYPTNFFQSVFNIKLDFDQIKFVQIYFIAVIIGQVGNLMVVRLRSAKENKLVTINMFISEIVIQLGLMQLLVHFNLNNSKLIGFTVVLYCTTHLVINFLSLQRRISTTHV